MDGVICPRCGTENPAGSLQCSAPGCRGFLPGNALARRGSPPLHGVKSGETLAKAADVAGGEIEAALGEGPGSEQRYTHVRWLASLALARTRLLVTYLDSAGWLDRHGRPRPAVKLLDSAQSAALAHLAALGMTPASAARLGVDLTRARSMTLAEQLAAERKAAQ